MKNKKNLILIIIIFSLLFLLFFVLGILYYNKINSIKLYIDNDVSKSVYNIQHNQENVFSLDYQNLIESKLDFMEKLNDYTFNNPLLILNPYNTNVNSIYIFFKTGNKRALEYTISVDDENIPDYKNMLVGDLTNIHKGLIIGLIQGVKNTVTFRLLDENLEQVAIRKVVINLPIYNENAVLKIETTNKIYSDKITPGLLFSLKSDDISNNNYLSLYDNNGILRADLYNNSIEKHSIQFTETGSILYLNTIDNKKIISINKYGKLEDIKDSINLDKVIFECSLDTTNDNLCSKYSFNNIWFGTLKKYLNYGVSVEEEFDAIKISSDKKYRYDVSSKTLLGMNGLTVTDFIYYDSIYFDVYNYGKAELIIPSMIDDVKIKKITGIHINNVKVIKIEEGIEEIADYCFVGVNKLEKLYVPKTVKKIGKDIFGNRNAEIIYY